MRVPSLDGDRVVGALAAWVGGGDGGVGGEKGEMGGGGVGWRVRGRGEWLGGVLAGAGGRGVFG